MCGLTMLGERYMVLIKKKSGHRAFCSESLLDANSMHKNLKIISALTCNALTGNFTVLENIYFAKGPDLRKIVLGLNAKEGLLGSNYQKWNLWQKFNANRRIWQQKLFRFFSRKEFKPKALTTITPF